MVTSFLNVKGCKCILGIKLLLQIELVIIEVMASKIKMVQHSFDLKLLNHNLFLHNKDKSIITNKILESPIIRVQSYMSQ